MLNFVVNKANNWC